jgi:hypothetical protein
VKLKFKIARSTTFHGWVLVDKILSELNKRDYRILNSTSSVVEFDDSPWKLMSNYKAVQRLDGGKFEISIDDNFKLVTFTYYRSVLWPVIILTILSVSLIAHGQYYAPLYFLAFYLIAITVNVVMLKSKAEEILNEIVN